MQSESDINAICDKEDRVRATIHSGTAEIRRTRDAVSRLPLIRFDAEAGPH